MHLFKEDQGLHVYYLGQTLELLDLLPVMGQDIDMVHFPRLADLVILYLIEGNARYHQINQRLTIGSTNPSYCHISHKGLSNLVKGPFMLGLQ